MPEKKTQIAVRITDTQRKQLEVIAENEGRTANAEIAFLVKQRIEQYRKDNPEIQLDILTK